jgi:cytochrome P450
LWDNPDQFDIQRFAPERKAEQHRFQHIPFGAGPRICVGARFAVVEALTILANWLAARRFSLPQDALPPMPHGTITLRPKAGMPLVVEPIQGKAAISPIVS